MATMAAVPAKSAQDVNWSRVGNELMSSGISVSIANTCTNPLDVLKVRLQLQHATLATGAASPGMVQTGVNIVRNEGVLALWNGLTPSLARGFFFGGARLGLYSPVKQVLAYGTEDPAANSVRTKVLAGALSGGIAAAATTPIELIKTRLQSSSGVYSGPVDVIKKVVEKDGVYGLWKGSVPGLVRSTVLTAAQCATYDQFKGIVMSTTGMGDCLSTHLVSSMMAGLITTTITNPIDVVKTYMFVGKSKAGPLRVCMDIIQKEGPAAFMKGWSASYARLGPHTVIMFMAAEKLRPVFGLKQL